MKRLAKFLFLVVLLCGGFATYSYAGARFAAGRLLGADPPLTGRTVQFKFQGVPELPGTPRAWIFSYHQSRLPSVPRAWIYVSPTGRVIATRPQDLQARVDAWEKARLP